jgi:hypothetical protein
MPIRRFSGDALSAIAGGKNHVFKKTRGDSITSPPYAPHLVGNFMLISLAAGNKDKKEAGCQ